MNNEIPKVIKAASLPNNLLMLDFDNGERRYLSSHYLTQYVNAFGGDSAVTAGTKRTLLVSPTISFFGNAFKITSDGMLIVNDKDTYTSEELWKNSSVHISGIRRTSLDAGHWVRNLMIALGIILFFVVLVLLFPE
ncbi:hypothetical protein Hs30E_11030 [Lactococcus hodotermopsidis]|uniref:Uncharacterized protein n=1 Tax=Pseudolactococcus hodotermopsidis TaxID=2709157 RepID=A0A6A0BB26_9LACT|nr:hypothetical protein [Lactococcus hodotermopsidis]GFH42552.1 hypothetical protein Hs30E_11030 [Lactococcus hodotermopsidis]